MTNHMLYVPSLNTPVNAHNPSLTLAATQALSLTLVRHRYSISGFFVPLNRQKLHISASPCNRCKKNIPLGFFLKSWSHTFRGSRNGAVVRALASYQCGPSSISEPDAISGLSFSWFLLCLEGFSPGSPGSPVFLPQQNPTYS